MMFATLDDVEGQVEMLVLARPTRPRSTSSLPDAVVIVRGRVDHKDRGETKLVVQEARALRAERGRGRQGARGEGHRATSACRSTPPTFGATLIEELKAIFENFPGDSEVLLEMETREGTRGFGSAASTSVRRSAGARRRARRAARRRVPGRGLIRESVAR